MLYSVSVCECFADTDMTMDEKYKKMLEEIEALKDHLGTTTYKTSCCRYSVNLAIHFL